MGRFPCSHQITRERQVNLPQAIFTRCIRATKVCLLLTSQLITILYHPDRNVPFEREASLVQNVHLRMAGVQFLAMAAMTAQVFRDLRRLYRDSLRGEIR